MSMSQPAASTSRTSAWMCGPSSSHGSRSQLHASWPRSWNAVRTVPENSHATRTLTLLQALVRVRYPARNHANSRGRGFDSLRYGPRAGAVADRLGTGLQSLVAGFDSRPRLSTWR